MRVRAVAHIRSTRSSLAELGAVLVDHRRQGRHEPAEEVGGQVLRVRAEDEQRCRLAHDPGQPEQHAGDDPESAVGRTTRTMVVQRGTPRAREASRSSLGTSFNISSVVRTTTGIMRSTSARQTAKPTRWKPKVPTHTAYTNRAATMDGTPVRMSTMKLTARASRPRPNSTR